MNKTIKIDRAKFIERLEAIKEILVDACKNDRMHYIAADSRSEVEDTAAFRNGMIEEIDLDNECPLCGGEVYMQDSDQCGGPYEVYVCKKCGLIPNELYEKRTYAVSPDGVAKFVKESLGCKYVHPCGDGNFCLGKLYGRRVYFCVSPVEGLFNQHNENAILVVCDYSSIPKGWQNDTCKAVQFTELFYMKDGTIRLGDAVEDLKPKDKEPRFGKYQRVADRRDEWLQVLAHILAMPYDPSDFRKNKKTLRMMLTSTCAARVFAKLFPNIKVTPKQFTRDMMAFCSYDRKTDVYDKREPVIAALLKAAANPKYTDAQRRTASKFAMDQLLKARNMAENNGGIPVNLPDVKFAVGADGRSEAVIVTPGDSVYERIAI
jgi:predicted RNA-binding Zn-ribbon protein involved in translation (DUF1610 family)